MKVNGKRGFWSWTNKIKTVLGMLILVVGGIVWAVMAYDNVNISITQTGDAIRINQNAIKVNQSAIESTNKRVYEHEKEDDSRHNINVINITRLQSYVESIKDAQDRNYQLQCEFRQETKQSLERIADKIDKIDR